MVQRRRKQRNNWPAVGACWIELEGEAPREVRLADVSEWGVGVDLDEPIRVGDGFDCWGLVVPKSPAGEKRRRCRAIHCRLTEEGSYRVGAEFADAEAQPGPEEANRTEEPPPQPHAEPRDLYGVLQINPNAEPEVVSRVYRLLAQRYHPDNPATGDTRAFQEILEAYRTLSDPERRAAYDARRISDQGGQWRVFEGISSEDELGAERRKRTAVLAALYAKRRSRPESEGMTLRELEELLGVPREHLEFPIWYLKSRKLIVGPLNNGRFEITIDGVEAAEADQERGVSPRPTQRQIEAPHPEPIAL